MRQPPPPTDVAAWERRCESWLRGRLHDADAAHDLEHVRRVVENARALAPAERAAPEVVLPAAWLHDCVPVPKHSPERPRASRLSADAAGAWLRAQGYPEALVPRVEHAIHAHSFSAGVEPSSAEAAVVQDADRLDALGAVGIARTLMLGGAMGRPLYDPEMPFPTRRPPDDARSTIDHFYTKLLRLSARMRTRAGRVEAERRTALMRRWLRELAREIGAADPALPLVNDHLA